MKMRKEDEESASEDATMDHALAWSRNVFEAQVGCKVKPRDSRFKTLYSCYALGITF